MARGGLALLRPGLGERRLVGGVHEDARAGLLQPRGDPDVVAVGVREDDGLDVAELAADLRQVGLERVREAGEPRVHGGHPPALDDEVPVDQLRAEAVHPGRQLYGTAHAYRPLNSGARFSANARVPSVKSSVRAHISWSRTSCSSEAASVGLATPSRTRLT